ncbi:Dyp-type peroxidase [Prescottella agglutinans]|uniref:Dye decolorizing peroxidase n=1 Tax=Prescottella agglutinans TaxID=1644129 RepID=A0ABT6MAI4_9NOCA|nr:Dyp-type peroxidase [Prescottella agglutinans]MDH6280895.1 dye decolorizing peroxidase [Prescottella agglutinans]
MADISRRRLLGAGAVAVGGVGLGWGAGAVTARPAKAESVSPTVPFYGEHQAGIETPPPAHTTFVGLDLRPGTDRAALVRMMRVWTDDAARLTAGRGALADTEAELATAPARLTVTVGFGPGVFRAAGLEDRRPSWCKPLPPFEIDKLDPKWNDGDVLLQVGSDDPVTVAHAVRVLLKDARNTTTVRWVQRGFRRARGSEPEGTTMRNLMGQVDGTVNPKGGSGDFTDVVWNDGAAQSWMAGGTSVVIRRIHLDLDGWDELDGPGRDEVMGRRMSDGAPLTGESEFDTPDFEAVGPGALKIIPEFSHIARARPMAPRERFLRRAYNYDEAPDGVGVSDSGLIFVAYQADVDVQYVPVQQRLAEADMFNRWSIPIGSAVFAIPPGCREGEYLGEGLLA